MVVFIKGIIIGMFVSFPVGPLGIITIQRTINGGFKKGFYSGLGAALSDIVFSTTAIFGVSFFHGFLIRREFLIDKIAGILLLIMGVYIFFNADKNEAALQDKKDIIHPAISNLLLGLTNPFMFIIFLMLFAKMGLIFSREEILRKILLIAYIFTGAELFWLLVSSIINKYRAKLNLALIYRINRITGILIAAFGVFSIVKGILKIQI